MTSKRFLIAWSVAWTLIWWIGAFVIRQSEIEAASPSHELQVGQTYEVMWGCNASGCAVEILTIAHVDKKSGWAQDTKGYWFHQQNMMAYRVAQKVPESPHPIVTPTERVQR